MEKTKNEILYEKIIENYYGTILVIDRHGSVIYVNNNVLINTKDITKEEILGTTMQSLVERGYFTPSSSLEALRTGIPTTRYIQGNINLPLMTTSIPVYDDEGELELVVAYSQDMNYVHDMIKTIKYEKDKTQSIINYTTKINKEITFIVESESMKTLYSFLEKVSYTDSTILLTGESGTGKEVVAKFIFLNSKRNDEVYLPVNCAAFPPELIESELFGYEKGAFTGANKDGKIGLFELASKGTLFLDEIGELSLSLQAKLLRVLENGEIKRIGSNEIKTVGTRIIAATNRDLLDMVSKNKFREDLYYRLNVIPVNIPPIRERKEDIIPLSHSFLSEFNRKYGQSKVFASNLEQALISYNWPGNVREIKNVIERMFIISNTDIISLTEFPKTAAINISNNNDSIPPNQMQPNPLVDNQLSYKDALKQFETQFINNVLDMYNGNVTKSAKHMQISRSDLYYKIGQIRKETPQ